MYELLGAMIWIVTQIFHFLLTLVCLALLPGLAMAAAKILKGGVRKPASDTRVREI